MARHRTTTALLLASLLTSCSLFTSLSGLREDGVDGPDDAATDVATPVDAAPDAPDSVADAEPSNPRSAAYRAAVLADGPIAYWRLEETAGTVAKAEIGAVDAQYRQSPQLGAEGVAGSRAVVLNNSAHLKAITRAFAFVDRAPFTIEIWVKPAAFGDLRWLMSTEPPGFPRYGWSIIGYANGAAGYEGFAPEGGPVVRYVGVPTLTLTRFAHLVFTYDGTKLSSYLDGIIRETENDTSPHTASGDFYIGCAAESPDTVSGCASGWAVDEPALYDKPLTAARVAAHYAAGTAAP
ncbi:MAG: LamG domain-containing protein [Labilithrix sp.]|nr:LamG domain-containing protein [Labilithrix sp.]